jgi:hypothetical protein
MWANWQVVLVGLVSFLAGTAMPYVLASIGELFFGHEGE